MQEITAARMVTACAGVIGEGGDEVLVIAIAAVVSEEKGKVQVAGAGDMFRIRRFAVKLI
jgi:hypothetical protein